MAALQYEEYVRLRGERSYSKRRTLESPDHESAGGGDDGDGGLTVLDGQLDGYAQTFPLLGGLGDIFTDFLG